MTQPAQQATEAPTENPSDTGTGNSPQAALATITTAGNGNPAERPTPGRDGIPINAIVHGTCSKWWTGSSRSHCAACHQTFSGETAADKHRTGKHGIDRHCIDPASVGLVATQKPYGVMWSNPAPEGGYHFHTTPAATAGE